MFKKGDDELKKTQLCDDDPDRINPPAHPEYSRHTRRLLKHNHHPFKRGSIPFAIDVTSLAMGTMPCAIGVTSFAIGAMVQLARPSSWNIWRRVCLEYLESAGRLALLIVKKKKARRTLDGDKDLKDG